MRVLVSFVTAAVAAVSVTAISLAAPAGAATGEPLTRTSAEGPVTVAVTPVAAVRPGEPLRLRVVLDTHSVDLGGVRFDRAVVLRSASGTVPPEKVESTKGEGHHREAVLVFPAAAAPGTGTLEVVVKDVGGVPERVFRWSLPLAAGGSAAAAPGEATVPSGGQGAGPGGQMGGQMGGHTGDHMGDMQKHMSDMMRMHGGQGATAGPASSPAQPR